MKRIIAFVLCFLCVITIHAYIFRNYQVEDGLSHNSVWAVMQDHNGFMWFGTNDGLDRFDGKNFKAYRAISGNSQTIGCNFIHTMFETSKGIFLVGTKQGLYRFDSRNESFHHVEFCTKKDDDVVVNRIMESTNGDIWVACHGQGIYVLTPTLKVKRHYMYKGGAEEIPSNYIWTLVQDRNGVIWIGSDGEGLIRLDVEQQKFTKIMSDKRLGIFDRAIYSIYCDADNSLWIGTSGSGLCHYNHRISKATYYLNQPGKQILNIKAVTEYSKTQLIMGSENGLIVFDRQSGTYHYINDDITSGNVSNKSVFDIAKDREGAFWIATYFNGVNYFSPAINKFSYYGAGSHLSQKKNIISSFVEDENGKIWIGTKDDGITIFDPQSNQFYDKGINAGYHDIQQLFLDGDNLWISLYSKGVSVYNVKEHSSKHYVHSNTDSTSLVNDYVFAFAKTSEQNILLGTGAGADVYNPNVGRFSKLKVLNDVSIKDIEEDYKGNVWFATHGAGVYRFSSDGRWKHFVHTQGNAASLSGNNVNCIHQDAMHRIWIGTEGNGIVMFNPQKESFEYRLNTSVGLPSDIIYDILDDADGNLWISTGGGLVKIIVATKEIRTFGYMEALQKIRYNLKCALRASDNKLYFGGTNGFTCFNPSEITDNTHIPSIVITGFQISNKEVKPGMEGMPLTLSVNETDNITLKYNQSNFSFDYVALSYLSPNENQYAYMLEGFDKDWNYVGNQTKAYYMNIPPGKYVFRVKASNNDGVWNEAGRSIVIIIERPVWLSNWMIVIYVLLVLAIIIYSVRRYKNRLEKENRQKIEKYQAMKEKEIYESKIDFFMNVAHEIRTPLSLIVAPLETLEKLAKDNAPMMENLEIIDNNARRLLELINQLLDFRKVEEEMYRFNFKTVNVVEIVLKVYSRYAKNAQLNGISVNLNVEKPEIRCKVDVESIYKIISNFMSNAVKYAKSTITLSVREDGSNLLIAVSDDGCGMDSEEMKKIFEPFYQIDNKENMVKAGSGLGLSLSKSLAVKHNGQIYVQSEKGKGSTFTLQIPIIVDDVVQVADDASSQDKDFPIVPDIDKDSKHVLIVEDNVELRKFIVNNLKEYYKMFEAGNGVEALDILDKEEIDIIISDIIMPEMDGIELCRKVKDNPAYSYLPVILLSAKTDINSKIEGLESGADIYMEKPFSITQLRAQVNSIIENRDNIRNRFLNSPLQYYKDHKEKDNANADFIKKLNAIILEHITDENISIEYLSNEFSMSRSNLHKKVKNITGTTPNDYIRLIRLNRAAQLLSSGKYKIGEVCFLVGFNTPSYFSKCFFDQFGKLPKEYVQQVQNDN